MLNIQDFQKINEIEAQSRDIDIIVDEESQFRLAFELPAAVTLKASHCRVVEKISVSEIAEQDPFNFKELFHQEFVKLANKHERFKDSRSFMLKLAGVATLSGEFDRAEAMLSESIALNHSPQLLHKLGDTLILKGMYDRAIEAFEQTDLDNDVYSNLKIAYIHTRHNDIATAYKFLEKAQTIDPSDFRTRMFMGGIQLNSGQCEKAIRSFRVASSTKKDSSVLHVNLAASHWSLGHTDKTIKELKKAIAINPLNENALIFYADIMHQLGKNASTVSFLEYFVSLNQKSKFIWERLARAYYFTQKFPKAKNALEHQLSIAVEPHVYNNLGLVYWQLKEHKPAFLCMSKAIDKARHDNKQLATPLLNMSILLNEKKLFKESAKLLQGFIAQGNEDVDGRILAKIAIQYFVSLESLEETATAAVELKRFLNKSNIDIEGRVLLLCCKIYSDAVIMKDRNECEKSTEKLLSLIHDNKDEISEESLRFANNNIAFNCLLYDSLSNAQKFISKTMKYVGKDPYCTATYGLLHIKKGDIEEGVKLYETAISLANGRDFKDRIRQRMNFELGKYFISIGNNKDAAKYLIKSTRETNGYRYVSVEANNLLKTIQ